MQDCMAGAVEDPCSPDPPRPVLSMLSGATPADMQEAVPAGPSASASGPKVLVVVAGARGALMQPIEALCSWAMICSSFWFSRFKSSTCVRCAQGERLVSVRQWHCMLTCMQQNSRHRTPAAA